MSFLLSGPSTAELIRRHQAAQTQAAAPPQVAPQAAAPPQVAPQAAQILAPAPPELPPEADTRPVEASARPTEDLDGPSNICEVTSDEKVVTFDQDLHDLYLNPVVKGIKAHSGSEVFRVPSSTAGLSRGMTTAYSCQDDTDMRGRQGCYEVKFGENVAEMPTAYQLSLIPSEEFIDLAGDPIRIQTDPREEPAGGGIGSYRQCVFALLIAAEEVEGGAGVGVRGRLFIATGARMDQYHATVVNSARILVYQEQLGVAPEEVRVVSAGTVLFQPSAAGGHEVIAVLNDSGHFNPKSKSVRHVYSKLHKLGYDCGRICRGTSEILNKISCMEADRANTQVDHTAAAARACAWLEFITQYVAAEEGTACTLIGTDGGNHRLDRGLARSETLSLDEFSPRGGSERVCIFDFDHTLTIGPVDEQDEHGPFGDEARVEKLRILLAELQQAGVAVGVCSFSSRERLEAQLAESGLLDLFNSELICGREAFQVPNAPQQPCASSSSGGCSFMPPSVAHS